MVLWCLCSNSKQGKFIDTFDDFGKQSHRTENDNGVATEKYHSDFEVFKSDQLLETHTCEEYLQQEAVMPNINGKHLNNKMENSNERLLTEQCACDLTFEFPCSDMEFSSRKRTYYTVNKVAINLY